MTSTRLSAKQAAKETGKATSTITTAIKQGRLSAFKNENGSFEIEPVELFRAFPPKSQNQTRQDPINKTTEIANNNGALQVEVKYLNEQVADLKERLESSEKRYDEERAERIKVAALLEHQTKIPQAVAPQSQNLVLLLLVGILVSVALSVTSFVLK